MIEELFKLAKLAVTFAYDPSWFQTRLSWTINHFFESFYPNTSYWSASITSKPEKAIEEHLFLLWHCLWICCHMKKFPISTTPPVILFSTPISLFVSEIGVFNASGISFISRIASQVSKNCQSFRQSNLSLQKRKVLALCISVSRSRDLKRLHILYTRSTISFLTSRNASVAYMLGISNSALGYLL